MEENLPLFEFVNAIRKYQEKIFLEMSLRITFKTNKKRYQYRPRSIEFENEHDENKKKKPKNL